jgi:hypothetical protein
MARKAKPPPKSRQPSLDDPRWRPIIAVHKQLVEHDGDPHAAAFDLTAALTSGELRCKWRRMGDGAYERVPSAFWTNYKLSYGPEGLRVIPHIVTSPPETAVVRSTALARSWIDMPIGGAVFYVWKPDIDKIWPLLAVNMPKPEAKADRQSETPPRRKPGPTPKYDWPTVVARELIRRAKAGEKDPTAIKMIEFCADRLDYEPSLRSMQEWLKTLLG